MVDEHAVFKELEARKAAGDRPSPPPWARLSAPELINAADAFFADLLAWGDRVTCERSAFGQVVTWIVRLDALELGRVRVTVAGDQVTKTETMSAIAAGRDPAIFGELLGDLDDHLAQAAGEERSRPHGRRRLQFWDQPKHKKGGRARLEDSDQADKKRRKAEKYLKYLEARDITREAAAGLVGEPRSNLERWVKRLIQEA